MLGKKSTYIYQCLRTYLRTRNRFTLGFDLSHSDILLTPTKHVPCLLGGLYRLERDHMAGRASVFYIVSMFLFVLWTRFRYCLHSFLPIYDICFELISPRLTNLGKGVRSALGNWV